MIDADSTPPAESAAAPEAAARNERPAYLPEKFWDAASGSARVEALAKSYRELERKLGARAPLAAEPATGEEVADSPPASASAPVAAYRISAPHPLVTQDGDLDARLIGAGLTEPQAQLVYDLAAERLLPLVDEALGELEAQRQIDRLQRHFGGAEGWRETARQIRGWAVAHLPKDVAATLAGSADGVLAMHQMMRASEPELAAGAGEAAVVTEESLAEMMRDRRYWQKRDPEFVARVTAGFKQLYGS